MTGLHRKLGLLVVLAVSALSAPAFAFAQDVEGTFKEGVDLLNRGRDAEALIAFQKVLAAQPSHEQAYALWKSTEHHVWLEILVKGGDFELVAKRLMGLAEVGRSARKNDTAAIGNLMKDVLGDDIANARAARRQLAAEHGEYAVPSLLNHLGDGSKDEARVKAMQALTEMGGDVVLPLCAAFHAEDAMLRRNVAYVLGYIGDSRAAGPLGFAALRDENESVRQAAGEALAKCGGGDAVKNLLQFGQDSHYRHANVLAAHLVSDVTWAWTAGRLVPTACPRAVYGDELAKLAYAHALHLNMNNAEARMGLARAYVSEAARLQALVAGGVDLGDFQGVLEHATVMSGMWGADALDLALSEAVRENDSVTAAALSKSLAGMVQSATPGLNAALQSNDGALRTEAAIALAYAASLSRSAAGAPVVAALADASAREVVRTAVVIDADAARGSALAAALREQGMFATHYSRGAVALAMLHRAPGIDAIVVADSLTDLTTAQVIDDLVAEPALAKAALFIIAADANAAGEVWGERAKGVLSGAADAAKVVEALGAVDGDRARAQAGALRAATALAHLVGGATDLGAALPTLNKALTIAGDEVVAKLAHALAAAGTPASVEALTAVVANAQRSEAARMAAATALGAIFTRSGAGSEAAMAELAKVAHSADAPLALRAAAARALGALDLGADQRAQLMGHGHAQQ